MKIRTKAPLRLGLAGGSTDVSPYSELYGGCVLNATINMYAYCTLEVRNNNKIEFSAQDINETTSYSSKKHLAFDGHLDLFKGIYNRIIKDYVHKPLSFKLTTYSDAIRGSGLGGSSTMVVAILKAFVEWLHLPLGDYDIAHLAYEIERIDVGLAGGKQDQYAATFGGFNYIEFYAEDKVIVNPLRIKNWIINELEASMLIYFSGISREGGTIIKEQSKSVKANEEKAITAMHQIKKDAVKMKEALLLGKIKHFAEILDHSWHIKKRTSKYISNENIDIIYDAAKKAGAYGGKVSGAGGGGYMVFIVNPTRKLDVMRCLKEFGGIIHNVQFSKQGTEGWVL